MEPDRDLGEYVRPDGEKGPAKSGAAETGDGQSGDGDSRGANDDVTVVPFANRRRAIRIAAWLIPAFALMGALIIGWLWSSGKALEYGGNSSTGPGGGIGTLSTAQAEHAAGSVDVGPIRATGIILPSKSVEVGTQQTGQLRSLFVEPGDAVTKGQLLAEIDPDLTQNDVEGKAAAVEQVQAELHAAQADLTLAQRQKSRAKMLILNDAMARREYERAEADLARALARVDGGRAAVRVAQMAHRVALKNLEQTRLRAPIDGTVVRILIKEGQMVVGAQTAQVVLEVANLRTMTVEARVAEADVPHIHAGQKVSFSILADADQQWHSTLRRIDPDAIQKADTAKAIYYRALFDVDNADGRLRPMMTAEVIIGAQDRQAVGNGSAALSTQSANGVTR
ncbi:macrolide-specific efflux system membrane fusion protein [Robbsia andropogonis]|uniref:efflux RND transporter periplasmic adaptor subunit n=1 Tax=Robbsia andropogonis TaxID=28092 RepID=UPI0006970218|nr:efflux RND transporter periplasmic adaptor subunit [Robbsia andropogonis]MCP1118877.1 efflux RND transporter periplasmic adaptor subunit [Robbsia andropogonis]MCP1128344.1 efflux RND transporter periplasmic adaptor subunit [Robbsia andropogonis]